MARIARIFIAATIAVTAALPVNQSFAHDRKFKHHHGHNNPGWNNGKRRGHHRPPPRSNDNGDAVLLGVLGLAAGAIIAGALLSDPGPQPGYAQPAPGPGYGPSNGWAGSDYYPPAPSGNGYAGGGTIEPWTAEWYRFCSERYRSFKPKTGTFRGFDGQDHFCVAR